MRQCEVYVHGTRAGILTENDNREYVFTYDKSYLLNEKESACQLDSAIA